MARNRGAGSIAQRPRAAKRTAPALSSPFLRRLLGVLLAAVAVWSAISLVVADGGAARGWNALLRGGFGWGAYLVPLLCSVFGLALIWSTIQTRYRFQRREAAGWLLLFGCFVTLFQLLANDPSPAGNAAGGGRVGWSVVQAMVWAIGPGASFGITSITVLAGLLGIALAFALGPRELWGILLLGFLAALWLGRQSMRLVRLCAALARRGWRALLAHRTAPHFRINRPERESVVPPADLAAPPTGSALAPKAARPGRLPLERQAEKTADQGPQDAVAAPGTGVGAVRQWERPPLTLLETGGEGEPSETDIRQKVQVIEETLLAFGIKAVVVEVNPGPVVTQFGLDPGYRERRGRNGSIVRRDKVKVSEITALRDDLALALAARTVRIEAPVPGRAVIGLEIPNSTATVVQLRKVIETASFQRVRAKAKLAIALGQDVSGAAVAADLAKMPHLLIAGATGSGKSVCMNAIITCFLLHTSPDELRMVMIDPKRVELTSFRDVPHLLRSVVVDVEHAVTVLKWVTREMETRLKRFEAHGVRNIEGYHRLLGSRDGKEAMPYIAVLIDELADLMMTAPEEVERSICRLAQLARATGIHLVIATQRPSVDVITGLIKANFPTRISFAVASHIDSRTILDMAGAEQLLGSGDMLYMPADAAKPRRLQGVFVSDDEVRRVVEHWKNQAPPRYVPELEQAAAWGQGEEEQSDPIYERAVEVARQYTRVSASLLQRRLGVGYNRAARLIDLLAERGVIGVPEGGKPREVLPPVLDPDAGRSE